MDTAMSTLDNATGANGVAGSTSLTGSSSGVAGSGNATGPVSNASLQALEDAKKAREELMSAQNEFQGAQQQVEELRSFYDAAQGADWKAGAPPQATTAAPTAAALVSVSRADESR